MDQKNRKALDEYLKHREPDSGSPFSDTYIEEMENKPDNKANDDKERDDEER